MNIINKPDNAGYTILSKLKNTYRTLPITSLKGIDKYLPIMKNENIIIIKKKVCDFCGKKYSKRNILIKQHNDLGICASCVIGAAAEIFDKTYKAVIEKEKKNV